MEQNADTKTDFKEKFLNFYKLNKIKFYILIILISLTIITVSFMRHINEKNNILTSEKYIQAGIYLTLKKKENAKGLYEEIILSNNKFYSILALNKIIENELVLENNKILNYFNHLEQAITLQRNKDLITLKKALFLIKISNQKEADDLLNSLIINNSNLKSIAKDLLKK